ncbi:putative exonuclease domain-containing protein At3g15140 [Apium graveolens]|uniref:putative exonuclease domain-containing protein At3g15140 n=1 Tax=Apium graveolens TaxID=4045 RepID=UPI003D794531
MASSSVASDCFSAEESSLATTMGSSSGASDCLSTEVPCSKGDFFDVFKAATPRKPLCLYFTQGCCTMMDEGTHMNTHTHSFMDLDTKCSDLKNVEPQHFDYFLVLDLEGNIEILEFPVMMIDAKTLELVDFFHRFVRPRKIRKRIDPYVEQHYGKYGISSIWHETAIPFTEVIPQFEDWLAKHNLWTKELGGHLNKAAFITCGNWDIKTKIPEQCKVSRMEVPQYFMEWINIKDIYLNFYKRRASSMLAMMGQLQMPLVGNHHLGIDDATNITRIVQHLIVDGSVLQITARRNSDGKVEFLFENRIW